MLGRFLEFLVFDQLPDQVPARIVLIGVLLRRLLVDRQQAAALQVDQIRRHHDKLTCNVDIQFLESLEIFEILPRDALERDFMNVDLIAFDQEQQQIERSLENFQLNFVIGFHDGAPVRES